MGEEKLVVGTILNSMVCCKGVPCSMADPSIIMAEPFSESNWNQFASLDQHVDLDMPTAPSSYNPGMEEDQGVNSSNGYPAEQMPGLEFFGSEKIIGHLVLPEDAVQTTGSLLPTESVLSEEQSNGIDPKGIKRRRMPQSGAFDSLSSFNRIQTAEAEDEKDNMKKEKGEQIPRILPHDLLAHELRSEQAKGNFFNGDDLKEDYAHARAKRCQATKSHSLAERVRREKINQRMKFLQDLVPGCSKITRKASMLDEIINYVQSLQQQVQLSSMKLATAHPEMQFDIEHVLPSEILHSQMGNSGAPVIGTGFSASHFHFPKANSTRRYASINE